MPSSQLMSDSIRCGLHSIIVTKIRVPSCHPADLAPWVNGVGAAIGAKVRPDKVVLNIAGDGCSA